MRSSIFHFASLVAQMIKNQSAMPTDLGLIPGLGRSPEDGTATQSLFLPGESPQIEEPGGLKSMGSQRVGHD